MAYRIGISGWTYAGWRGAFYPAGLPQKRELQYAASCFNSIEVNGSFYSLQRPASYKTWYRSTPPGFLFSLKGGRYITHMRKLRDPQEPLANFFASGPLLLAGKLGPILWQFPAAMSFDQARFESFFSLLPRDTAAAARLAARHTVPKLKGVRIPKAPSRPLRYAVEIRHPSFLVPAFMRLLGRYGIALVFADTAGLFPYSEDTTSDFIYVRLHGAEELYASGYTDAQLDGWAARLRRWHDGGEPRDARRVAQARPCKAGRDVYVYFDNDAKKHAPFDAARLSRRLGLPALHPPGSPPAAADSTSDSV